METNVQLRSPILRNLIEPTPALGSYGLRYRYFKIAENEFSSEQLLAIQNIVSTLFLAETHFDREALIQHLLALFDKEEDRHAISLFINWCRQLKIRERMASADFSALEIAYRSREEVDKMLNVAMQRERELWVQENMAELLPRSRQRSRRRSRQRSRPRSRQRSRPRSRPRC